MTFEQLKEKYPNITLVKNEMYTTANNISSAFQMFKLADAYSNYNYNNY